MLDIVWVVPSFLCLNLMQLYFLCISAYRKVASSRPVYYSIWNHFSGATHWDVLLTDVVRHLWFNLQTFFQSSFNQSNIGEQRFLSTLWQKKGNFAVHLFHIRSSFCQFLWDIRALPLIKHFHSFHMGNFLICLFKSPFLMWTNIANYFLMNKCKAFFVT